MSETLLFLHILAAFMLVASVVIWSAFVLGSPVNGPSKLVAQVLEGVGGIGTLVLGIWLALDLDQHEITDGWILGSIVLWLIAGGAGDATARGIQPSGNDSALTLPSNIVRLHWIRTIGVLALIVVMVYKPGA